MLVLSTGALADYETGYKENVTKMDEKSLLDTPPENVFRLAGDDQEFILLDTSNDENSTFFVMSKQDYGNTNFGQSQKFDINDKKSIAYFLNNDFKGRTYQFMTKAVLDYIDYNHVWYTEPGNKDGAGDSGYTTTCGLAVMSLTEWHQYKDKFGIRDNISSSKTDGWWLRTARVGGDVQSVFMTAINPNLLGNQQEWKVTGGLAIRPVFWLKRDFFKDNRLDLENTGENVIKALKEVYQPAEIQNDKTGYLNHEMRAMGFSVEGIDEIANAEFFDSPYYIMDQENAGFDFSMKITGSQSLEYDLIYTVKDKEYSEKITVAPNVEFKKQVIFANPPKGVYDVGIKVIRDEKTLYSRNELIGVIDIYEKQFMDEYSRMRMCTHFEYAYNYNDDFQLDILKKAGVYKIRDLIEWGRIEPEKGIFDFSYPDKYMQFSKDKGVDVCLVLSFSNKHHVIPAEGDTWDPKYAPRTKEEIEAFANYAKELVLHYPEVKIVEIWNESNWPHFWTPEPNAIDYATLVREVSTAVREVRDDIKLVGCSFVYHKLPYFDQWLKQNVLPYVDAVSTHPYFFPSSVDTTPAVSMHGDKAFNSYGGFTEWYSTEVGLPTSTNSMGISEEGQADAVAKYWIYSDYEHFEESMWYDFRDDGTNAANNEHNFGLIKYDYTPKPGYAALSQSSNVMNGSVYLGELDYGEDIRAFAYLKNAEPFVVIWNTKDDVKTVSIEHTKVEDIYGNEIFLDTSFSVDKDMKYLFGVPRDIIRKAAVDSAMVFYEEYLKEYSDLEAQQDKVNEMIEKLKTADASQADALIDENINIGLALLENSGNIPLVKVSEMLNQLRYAHEALAGLYSEKNKDSNNFDYSKILELEEKIAEYKNGDDNIRKPLTERLLSYAQKYKTRIEEITGMGDNPGKNQVLNYYYALTKTDVWAQKLFEMEDIDANFGLLIYTHPSKMTVYQGETQEVAFSLKNKNLAAANGLTAKVLDNEGNVIFETEKFNAAPGESVSKTVNVEIPDTKLTGDYEYTVAVYKDSQILTKQNIFVTVKGVVNVKLLPSERSLITTKNIDVEIENTYNKPMAFQVTLKTPEGWVLKKNTIQTSVGINSKKVISFPVAKKEKVPFNHYQFEIIVSNERGAELIRKIQPLDMPIAVMNKDGVAPADFDGDITSWQNAYPVYIEAPSDVHDKEQWKKAQLSARMYAKWDNKYFYFLCDVNDDTYVQSYNGTTLWQGDSIQVSLDTKNDKATMYLEDDFELGMSYTDKGEEIYAYFFGMEEFGPRESEWVKIIRDNTEKVTRYYARIPLDRLAGLRPKKGQKFGFNVAINDADLVARDNQFYLTPGTGSPINPSQYLNWVFWNYEIIKKGQGLEDVPVAVSLQDIFHKE